MSESQQREVDELKATDRRVRAHELAHLAAAGELAQSGASYDFKTGPDKQRYAVAGEVSIAVTKGGTPEETIAKAQRIRQAALAPADPSAQDQRVAAYASQLELEARQELSQQAAEQRSRAGNERDSRAIGAYQAVGGLDNSAGFKAAA